MCPSRRPACSECFASRCGIRLSPGRARVLRRMSARHWHAASRALQGPPRQRSRACAPAALPAHSRPEAAFRPSCSRLATQSRRALYAGLLEDLASRGFVVVGVDHTYETSVVELPGGRLIRATLPQDPPSGPPSFGR